MRYFLGLCILGLLFTGCAKNPSRQHEIICFSPQDKSEVHHIITAGNVFVFIVKSSNGIEHPVLGYKDVDMNQTKLIYIEMNDCVIY